MELHHICDQKDDWSRSLSLPAWIYVVDKPISQLHHLFLGAKFPPTQPFLWDMHGYFALSKLWRRLLLPA
jgi:hypothetical protein